MISKRNKFKHELDGTAIFTSLELKITLAIKIIVKVLFFFQQYNIYLLYP